MKIALPHNHYDPDHLDAVTAEMQVLGAPTIKAVWMECYGVWAALEGSHRIRAAANLRLSPIIDEIAYSDTLTTADIGLVNDFGGDIWTIAEVADEACSKEIKDFVE